MEEPQKEPATPSLRSSALAIGVAFLPLFFGWLYKALLHPRQFYAFYYDPETIYFYDGLRLLRGVIPFNVDNPGTPLQLLSALIATVTTRDPLMFDRFRVAGYVVSFGAKIVVAFFLTRTLLRRLPMLLQIAAIWSFFLAPHALEYDVVWSPEAFYFTVGGLLLIALSRFVDEPSRRRALWLGIAAGVAVALKVTLLAWIPAIFVAIVAVESRERIKQFVSASVGIALGFFVATLPIITRYGATISHLGEFARRTGSDGRGAVEKVTLGLLWSNVERAVQYLPAWHLFLAACIAVAAALLLRARASGHRDRRGEALALAAVVGVLAEYVLASRHIQLRHLIACGLGSMTLLAAIGPIAARWRREVVWILFGLIGAILLYAQRIDLIRHDERIANTEVLRARVQSVIASRGVVNPIVVYAWHYPEPSFALRSLAYEDRYYAAIERGYPRDGHYDVWTQRFYLPGGATDWDFLVIDLADIDQIKPSYGRPIARIGEYFVLRRVRVALAQ